MNKQELKWHFKGLSDQDRSFRFLQHKTDFLIDEWIDGISDFSDWIVHKDGESIIAVGQVGKMDEKKKMFEISFSVDADYRRKGRMKKLYQELIEKVQTQNGKMLYATFDRDNKAVGKFLQKEGFELDFSCSGVVIGTKNI